MTAPTTPQPLRTLMMLTNPAAGGGQAIKAARAATAHLRKRGISVLEVIGVDRQDARRLARQAVDHRLDALAVAGGDGMISLALQELIGTNTALGVVPAGTGNDLARAHGLPLRDPVAAADVIADANIASVDVGHIQTADGTTRYFASVLATGFDSLVSDRANRLRWPRGRARYNLAVLAEFSRLRPLPFRIVLADGTVMDRDLTLAAVGNSPSYGGGMLICPEADPTDGLLDITLVHAMSRRKAVRFFPTVFRGTHVLLPEVQTHRTTAVSIASPGITAYADGEYVGPLPARIRAMPRALRLIAPPSRALPDGAGV